MRYARYFLRSWNTALNLSFSHVSTLQRSNIITKKIGPITCIGLNRPAKKNCLNLELLEDLRESIENFENDDSSLVGVIYGERGTFCYGYDQDEFIKNPKLVKEVSSDDFFEKYSLKPIVAAVSGHALGPGFDLALWCDFRIVEETALLGGYARNFGTPTSQIIIQRMYSLLGLNKAMDVILTGRVVAAKEALDCGVATRLVACGAGLGQAVSFAHSLANVPQSCLKSDRAALLSLSQKYSASTTEFIKREMNHQRLKAMKEAKDGLHITTSGDTRLKENEPGRPP